MMRLSVIDDGDGYREIIFPEASALLPLLDQKLRNSDLDLGPKGLQCFFAQHGVMNADMKEFIRQVKWVADRAKIA